MDKINLKRVKLDQLKFNHANFWFTPLDNATRWKNSRGSKCVRGHKTYDFTRWCEQCGAPFSTVNETRRLCDKCHDEICEALGVDYTIYKMPTKPKAKKTARKSK